jgi:hypothetical protein
VPSFVTQWGIGDVVTVDNVVTGTVVAIMVTASDHTQQTRASYQVLWWDEGEPQSNWLDGWRLSP